MRSENIGRLQYLPERSRRGMGAALGLDGYETPPLWTHGEVNALHVRDDEALRLELARVKLQQERDAAASTVDLGEVVP